MLMRKARSSLFAVNQLALVLLLSPCFHLDGSCNAAHAFATPKSISQRPAELSSSSDVGRDLSRGREECYREAVVVGGGPVGLATALTLSNPPHCYNVTVLEQTGGRGDGSEKTSTTSVAKYNPGRAYLYNVNPRGFQWFNLFPNARDKLFERGSSPDGTGRSGIVIVPADPEEPIPVPEEVKISGVAKVSKKEVEERKSVWVPRHQMVELLSECCKEQEEERLAKAAERQEKAWNDDEPLLGSVRLLQGKKCQSVESYESDNVDRAKSGLVVRCEDGTSYPATLVVAADGIDSSVRACLSQRDGGGWLQSRAKQFRIRRYRSPATGLRLKALQFPPNFTIPNSDGTLLTTESETLYALRGVHDGRNNRISIGFLPVKDPNMVRPGNTHGRHDHDLWKLKDGPSVKAFFQKAFPRVDFNSLVDDEEWERFAKAEATAFPYCQYSPGSAVASPDGQVGVVMVGDACHAFPPDIGQGINAGLQDVVALDRAMRGVEIYTGNATSADGATPSLGQALEAYQNNRRHEHRGLIRLARFGAPYQYRQSWYRDRVGRSLWMMNFVFRMMLSKFTGGLLAPQAMAISTQRRDLSFLEIMRRADTTTAVLKSMVLVLSMAAWFVIRK